MQKFVKIGNAQGFWGDQPGAAATLISQQPDLDYLTLDYLAEVSMSIMAIQQEKDPHLGYARDFIEVIDSLIPFWNKGLPFKVVSNAGGLNPIGCAEACQKVLQKSSKRPLKIGIMAGDNVLNFLKETPQNPLFANLDTNQPLTDIAEKLVTANAYLGAEPISEALKKGADIVITGRTADPSLTVGPCLAHFGWELNDYHRLAGATIAGHLIECGTQVTGGVSTNWLDIEDPAHLGFPVAEIFDDGSFVITKPPSSSGQVTLQTVKEQLLYEIGDPGCYLSPDATVSFLSLTLEMQGKDRVLIKGAIGKPPPLTYKVSATYREGFKTEAFLAIFGPQAVKKGRKCGEIILQRVKEAGFDIQKSCIECLGSGDVVRGLIALPQEDLLECVLRVAVADSRYEALERFSKEIAPMVTSGPQGITGYTAGRPHIRPIFGYWPCLIPKTDLVNTAGFKDGR
jgi:Acyclic terpene utilisation family protein AtuA